MINVFALAHVSPNEPVEKVYRSHVLRLLARLLFATACLALPFFFLFDYRGVIWIVAGICWILGLFLLWLAFDVWSSSVVFVTSQRIVGAERTSWGRVRVCDWQLSPAERVPTWKPSRLLPFLGTLTWKRADGHVLELPWASALPVVKKAEPPSSTKAVVSQPAADAKEPSADMEAGTEEESEREIASEPTAKPTLEERRKRLITKLQDADEQEVERLEKSIDDPESA